MKDTGIVIGLDRCAVGTLSATIINTDSGQAKYDAAGQCATTLQVGLQPRQITCLEFGETVEHDARELMIDERIAEALHYVVCETAQLLLGQIKGRQ